MFKEESFIRLVSPRKPFGLSNQYKIVVLKANLGGDSYPHVIYGAFR